MPLQIFSAGSGKHSLRHCENPSGPYTYRGLPAFASLSMAGSERDIRPTLDFKTMKSAYATIKGFEVMRALKKGQARPWRYQEGIMGEVRLIERNFGLAAI